MFTTTQPYCSPARWDCTGIPRVVFSTLHREIDSLTVCMQLQLNVGWVNVRKPSLPLANGRETPYKSRIRIMDSRSQSYLMDQEYYHLMFSNLHACTVPITFLSALCYYLVREGLDSWELGWERVKKTQVHCNWVPHLASAVNVCVPCLQLA